MKICFLKYIFNSFFFLLLFAGCNHSSGKAGNALTENQTGSNNVKFAKGFTITTSGNIKILHVFNPWEGARGIDYTYVLCGKDEKVSDSLKRFPVIYTPIQRIVCLSTSYIAGLSFINRINTIVGVSGTDFVSDSAARSLIRQGKIHDVGYDQMLNYELIVSLKPDLVMAYGIRSETATQFKKLQELGVKVVLNGDYLESDPLGKLEWVKFLAAFYNLSEPATAKFDSIVNEYQSLEALCDTFSSKPVVLSGLPWKGSWFVPGGESYAAKLIHDAGGDYLWKDVPQRESIPLNFEKVFERANKATIWINCGNAESLAGILNEDDRLKNIRSFQLKQVYNNNNRMNESGGNDFWESGLTHPQIILKDLIKIFHPEVLPHHSLVYYKKLN